MIVGVFTASVAGFEVCFEDLELFFYSGEFARALVKSVNLAKFADDFLGFIANIKAVDFYIDAALDYCRNRRVLNVEVHGLISITIALNLRS